MKQGQAPVRTRMKVDAAGKPDANGTTKKSVTIGEATFPIFESLQEAIGAIGEAEGLRLINVQSKTDAMNKIRGDATGIPSKQVLQAKAFRELMGLPNANEIAKQGDAAIDAKVAEIVLRLETEAKEGLNARIAQFAQTEGDEEDED